jgi:hypothetical protein
MTFRAIAATSNIKNLMSVGYVMDASNVLLTANRTQLIGKYPTLKASEEAIKGLITKNGSANSKTALADLHRTCLTSIDITPTTSSFPLTATGTTYFEGIGSYSSFETRITDIASQILLRLFNNNAAIQLWYKTSMSTIPQNTGTRPELDGYTLAVQNEVVPIENLEYIRFKVDGTSTQSGSISVINALNNSSVGSLPVAVSYT